MATLSRADVEHVAHLARLGLTEDELGRLEGQLNHILDQYAILAELYSPGAVVPAVVGHRLRPRDQSGPQTAEEIGALVLGAVPIP